MRQDFDILRPFEVERIAVIILRKMLVDFRNAANQIAERSNDTSFASNIALQNVPQLSEQGLSRKKPLVMSVLEASKVLGISKPIVYELTRAGKLRCIRVGKAIRISEQAILDYIHNAEQESQNL